MRSAPLLLGLMAACEPDAEALMADAAVVKAPVVNSWEASDNSCLAYKAPTNDDRTQFGEIYADPILRKGDVCHGLPTDEMVRCSEEQAAKEDKENRDPDLIRLSREFEAEAKRQVQAVSDAGGFCNLPLSVDLSVCAEYDGRCPDYRLGNKLAALAEQKERRVDKLYPVKDGRREFGLGAWSVELGRAECEAVKSDEDAPYLEDEIDEFNALCAESQGGLLTDQLSQNPYALHQLLIRRGTEVVAHLSPLEESGARAAWVNYCSPESLPDAMTPLEEQQFLGSTFPMVTLHPIRYKDEETNNWETAAFWTCPHPYDRYRGPVSFFGNNLDRNSCGQVTVCVADPDQAASEFGSDVSWGSWQLVKLPNN